MLKTSISVLIYVCTCNSKEYCIGMYIYVSDIEKSHFINDIWINYLLEMIYFPMQSMLTPHGSNLSKIQFFFKKMTGIPWLSNKHVILICSKTKHLCIY